ncbi:hypothetical protein HHI36_023165 [Cryptolaemus montrouzieri]|uniref:GATA zinc finger domain-containing protein 1 n=1 Tax=Cryptolaemus montrouzieri TaxID=559131 RepID=A0ABD2PFT3_9CUCU
MPLRGTPVCLKCKATESPLWTNAENLGAICLNCVNETKESVKTEGEGPSSTDAKPSKQKLRTRSTRLNPFALPKFNGPKSKGRRSLFKKAPLKAPEAVATPITSESVFCEGFYYQKGDIVSLIGEDDNNTYYAQIRGLLTDQYCEKSAVITWLLPTRESPPPNECFDPSTYVIGPEEDTPRSLRCMEFIMHAPSDYYKANETPYCNISVPAVPGYIWTSLKPVHKMEEVVKID